MSFSVHPSKLTFKVTMTSGFSVAVEAIRACRAICCRAICCRAICSIARDVLDCRRTIKAVGG